MTSLTSAQIQFIESVVRLEPRIAAFDCDGTLWSGDAGEQFFSWELNQGLVSEEVQRWARLRYADYRARKVPEDVMCGEMVTMHRGLREEVVQQAADEWFAQAIAVNIFIFPEMQELLRCLHSAGCDVWAVSSTNLWVIRAGVRYFDIRPDRILAAEVAIDNGIVTDRLIRVPSGSGKPDAIRQATAVSLDCAFGNSIWDREMLAMSKHPFAIDPTPDLSKVALGNGWRVYQPEANIRGQGA